MNLSSKTTNELLFINFNQDYSCISVGTKNGYRIFNCDPFGKCFEKNEGGIGVVEMLFCTSLVALVGAGEQPAFSPRRLQISNTKRESVICELTFPTSILGVKLNRRRLIVILEDQIFIYDISNMKLLHTIETSPNPNAICALSSSSENSYLAYPAPSPSPLSPYSNNTGGRNPSNQGIANGTGEVVIFDTLSLQVVNIIQAHKSSLSYITINSDGTLLATASDKGTVIRVFSLPTGNKLYQFRRGSYAAKIYSISFNMMSTLLCVSSDTETVHIFKVTPQSAPDGNGRHHSSTLPRSSAARLGLEDDQSKPHRRSSFHEMLGKKIVGSVGAYLPEALSEMWEPARDFAFLKLPNIGSQSIVGLSNTAPQVMVITSDGYLYQYSIDLENGGECSLLKQYSLLESSDTQ